jgi:hypothetical protein
MLARELSAAERLQQVSTQLITTRGTEALYEQILDTALAILRGDFASIQQFYPDRGTGELRLLGHRGFSAEGGQAVGMGTVDNAHHLWRGFAHGRKGCHPGCPEMRFHGRK